MIKFDLYPGGRHHIFTASFDDGKIEDRRLVELFNKYDIKSTFCLSTHWLDKPGFVTSGEVSTLYAGHEICTHSVDHPDLTDAPREEVIMQIMEDRARLEELCGYPVRGFAPPGGDRNTLTDSIVEMCGMSYSRSVNFTHTYHYPDSFYQWNPSCHQSEAMPMVDKFVEAQDYPSRCKILYIMGHSYEFTRDPLTPWEHIEEICRKVSGLPDTWYATNIEILDYYKAVRSIQFTVDHKYFFNPTQIDVWFTVDGEAICLKKGEVLRR